MTGEPWANALSAERKHSSNGSGRMEGSRRLNRSNPRTSFACAVTCASTGRRANGVSGIASASAADSPRGRPRNPNLMLVRNGEGPSHRDRARVTSKPLAYRWRRVRTRWDGPVPLRRRARRRAARVIRTSLRAIDAGRLHGLFESSLRGGDEDRTAPLSRGSRQGRAAISRADGGRPGDCYMPLRLSTRWTRAFEASYSGLDLLRWGVPVHQIPLRAAPPPSDRYWSGPHRPLAVRQGRRRFNCPTIRWS